MLELIVHQVKSNLLNLGSEISDFGDYQKQLTIMKIQAHVVPLVLMTQISGSDFSSLHNVIAMLD
jgi:hypothetical protein